MEKSYTKLKKLKSRDSEIEFEAEIPIVALEESTAKVLLDIGSTFSYPGFRRGKVPEDIVRQQIDETRLFEDSANEALKDAIQQIVTDENVFIVGAPQISLEKISLGSPIMFKVKFALFPEIVLPDYKKLAKVIVERPENADISDEEVKQATERVQKMLMTEEEKAKSEVPPELSEEFVKRAGPFNSIDEFKAELKKQLGEEKRAKQQDAKKEEMMREIVKSSKLIVPPILIDQELERFKEQRDENIKAAGFTFESYLKDSGKTAEVMAKEERAFIEEQLKSQFVVGEIQRIENIVASQQEIEMNAEFLKFRYPDRSEEFLRNMAESIIVDRKTFDMLEDKKPDKAPVVVPAETEIEEKTDDK